MSESHSYQHDARQGRASISDAPADGADVETKQNGPNTESPASDVMLASSATGAAPSFPAPAVPARTPSLPPKLIQPPARHDARPAALSAGSRIGEFEVVSTLGRGAFGQVYLARQISLDRLVALKVSANRGSEGRTMARLEHRHIVQVFSETVDVESNQRLLCMQLVPGLGLEKLINALHTRPVAAEAGAGPEWDGGDLLAILDRNATMPPVLDPSAYKDREALERMDALEVTCWFGGRLGEALHFAHRHGVLHRDIKPANILVNSYGQPMLADFNISSHTSDGEAQGDEMFGGTFAYMAPEHLAAFNPDDDTKTDAVTAQSDVYSLALVIDQMLAGRLAFPLPDRSGDMSQILRQLTEQRRAPRAACREGTPCAEKVFQRTISRCLAPIAADRYASAAELAEQFDGCRRLRRVEQQLPAPPRILAGALTRPFLWLFLLTQVPQLIATVVNFTYNFSHFGREAIYDDRALVTRLAIIYNLIAYPIAIALLIRAVLPVWRCWRALQGTGPLSDEEVASARRQALRLPIWFTAITAVGWYSGGLVFPLIVKIFNPGTYIAHFMLAHLVSGLIALAYSLYGALFIVLRVFYPAMWLDTRTAGATAARELAPASFLLNLSQYLAGAIPLVGALFLLVVGDTADTKFRVFTTLLIGLGLVGFQTASTGIRRLSQVITTITKGLEKARVADDSLMRY